jgi:hypothetical protein
MSQSEPKESRVAESVTELDLEIVVVGHGCQKAPNTKLQAPENLQRPISNEIAVKSWTRLELGIWDLFGAWDLGFGAFIRLVLRKRGEEIRARLEGVVGLAG